MKRHFFTLACPHCSCSWCRIPCWPSPLPRPTPPSTPTSSSVEARLAQQHRSADTFLAFPDPVTGPTRLHKGERDRRAAHAFARRSLRIAAARLARHRLRSRSHSSGLRAADAGLRRLSADDFSPQVLQARLLARSGDRMQAEMRIRQQHVITGRARHHLRHRLWTPRCAARLQRLAQHAHRRDLRPRHKRRARPQPRAGARLPLAAEYLLELRGKGRRPLPAGRGRLPHPLHPPRPRLGHRSVYRKHSPRFA